ncbi:MAG: DUF1801 domain-containing protein [Fimbriimonadaceae bacterium]|nr:DUF1801 domain-containing protein [Fimbriimonadaceae bacterium]
MATSKAKPLDDAPKVTAFLEGLEHPLKAEIEAVRRIILSAHPRMTEGIKWNNPCFYYKGDMAVIHTRSQEYVHLIFPTGNRIPDSSGLLEGDYPDGRKMAYLRNMKDIEDKRLALESVVRSWVACMDAEEAS